LVRASITGSIIGNLLLFISLLFGQRLRLVFTEAELIALVGTALLAAFIALDGESN
jgi:Ca2+/H+ antiporter